MVVVVALFGFAIGALDSWSGCGANAYMMGVGDDRLRRRTGVVVLFWVGLLFGAVPLYTALGILGNVAGISTVALVALTATAAGSAVWYLSGRRQIPFGMATRQANRYAAHSGPLGVVYLGQVLGLGIATEMSTPLVWSGVLFAVGLGAPASAAFGLGFGLGRSAPVIAGAVIGERVELSTAIDKMLVDLPARTRPVGFVVSCALALVAVNSVVGWF